MSRAALVIIMTRARIAGALMASLLTWSPIASVAADVEIPLPKAGAARPMSLETAILKRRSVRLFAPGALHPEEVARLLWAAQGITDETRGLRSTPSAGALYPLEVYVVRDDGVFRYLPTRHSLLRVRTADERAAIAKATFDQDVVRAAPLLVVIGGIVERTRAKYGARAERFVTLEAGHAAQNVLLEATALDLAATPVGAFDDDALRAAIDAQSDYLPLYVIPVGRPAR